MFYIGLDLGQRRDFTAIAVVERSEQVEQRFEHVRWMQQQYPVERPLVVRYLERMPLGTPFPDVADRMVRLVRDPALGGGKKRLAVDATGMGKPVVDYLRKAKPSCEIVPVVLTGGERESHDGRVWHVPKLDLLGELQLALQNEELQIVRGLRETPMLVREMLDVRVRTGARGNARVGAEGAGEHDDLVVAVALACWSARRVTVEDTRNVRLFW